MKRMPQGGSAQYQCNLSLYNRTPKQIALQSQCNMGTPKSGESSEKSVGNAEKLFNLPVVLLYRGSKDVMDDLKVV